MELKFRNVALGLVINVIHIMSVEEIATAIGGYHYMYDGIVEINNTY